MKEIYAVVRRYLDRDRYTVHSGPEGDFYESREEAQKVADGLNVPLLERLAEENLKEKKHITRLNKEHDALVKAKLERRRKPLEAWVRTLLEEEYVVFEYDLHEVNDGT